MKKSEKEKAKFLLYQKRGGAMKGEGGACGLRRRAASLPVTLLNRFLATLVSNENKRAHYMLHFRLLDKNYEY
jgi:hypothetical protein